MFVVEVGGVILNPTTDTVFPYARFEVADAGIRSPERIKSKAIIILLSGSLNKPSLKRIIFDVSGISCLFVPIHEPVDD